MPESFAATLREFEKTNVEIGVVRERLEALELRRDQLRRQLKAVAGGTEFADSVSEVVEALHALGGTAQLADIRTVAKLSPKVAITKLEAAVKQGLVRRESHGKYMLSTDGLRELMRREEVQSASAGDVEADSTV